MSTLPGSTASSLAPSSAMMLCWPKLAWTRAAGSAGAWDGAMSVLLALDQVDDAGKVQLARPAPAVQRIQVACQLAQRNRGARRQRRLGRQPQVLEHQVHAKTAGIALG